MWEAWLAPDLLSIFLVNTQLEPHSLQMVLDVSEP